VTLPNLRRVTVVPVETLAACEPIVDVGGHRNSIYPVYTPVKRKSVPVEGLTRM
jgi:hypothetical protein